jgi:hypothetical protein
MMYKYLTTKSKQNRFRIATMHNDKTDVWHTNSSPKLV